MKWRWKDLGRDRAVRKRVVRVWNHVRCGETDRASKTGPGLWITLCRLQVSYVPCFTNRNTLVRAIHHLSPPSWMRPSLPYRCHHRPALDLNLRPMHVFRPKPALLSSGSFAGQNTHRRTHVSALTTAPAYGGTSQKHPRRKTLFLRRGRCVKL